MRFKRYHTFQETWVRELQFFNAAPFAFLHSTARKWQVSHRWLALTMSAEMRLDRICASRQVDKRSISVRRLWSLAFWMICFSWQSASDIIVIKPTEFTEYQIGGLHVALGTLFKEMHSLRQEWIVADQSFFEPGPIWQVAKDVHVTQFSRSRKQDILDAPMVSFEQRFGF